MKKILLFGSKGLVGSSIYRNLSNNYQIFPSSRADTDLFNYHKTFETIKNVSPDLIINAAAKVGGIVANNTQRTDFIIENLKINLNILESLKQFPNIEMINLGSSCIYPLNADNPIKEEYIMSGKLEPTNSPYAMAKLSAIEIGKSITQEYGNKIINLMPTNLYGENDNFSPKDSHVIPGLIRRLCDAKENFETEFKIWGSGKPLREFLYVDDLSYAIDFIIKNNITLDLLNVGSGDEISIKNLAEIIKQIIGFNGELTYDLSKPDGNPRKLLDTTKLNNLGWRPKISLENGLKKTVEWYLKNKN